MAVKSKNGTEVIRALARGLQILSLFGAERPVVTLTEAAELTGLPLPTAQRLLKTLEACRYVNRDGERGPYRLGPALLPLLPPLFGSMTVPELAGPHIRRLVEETEESANLAVLDGDEVLYLVNFSGPRLLTIKSAPGLRLPLHSTALGKCLLAQMSPAEARTRLGPEPYEASTRHTRTKWKELQADLAEANRLGYALSNEELEDGLSSCAMPVATSWPAPAAINVSAPASRWTKSYVTRKLVPALRTAAQGISAASRALSPDAVRSS